MQEYIKKSLKLCESLIDQIFDKYNKAKTMRTFKNIQEIVFFLQVGSKLLCTIKNSPINFLKIKIFILCQTFYRKCKTFIKRTGNLLRSP
jgi:hypothetical protein